jgi:lipoprotein-anchoring transpeptidase ErfK/SrfK
MRPIRPILTFSAFMALLAAGAACLGAPVPQAWAPSAPAVAPPQAAMPMDVAAEVSALQSALISEVPHLILDDAKRKQQWLARTAAALAAAGIVLDRPQLLVVVDRNPRVQQMRIVLAQPQGEWDDLGGVKVSTGEPGRYDYFLTPAGVFRHTDAILDWRAEGTFNAHHVRGLGEEGMRVWDFGWQRAVKGWRSARKVGRMRLLIHATDPDYLAQQLGRTASKGCIRIPEAMDRFLDRHGVLDSDYEQAAKRNPRFQKVLLPDRSPTLLAGDALVVIDSPF